MKAASLFHLMQIRARKLEERADEDCKRHLRAIQTQLKISHTRGWLELSWRFGDRDFSLNVPDEDFAFHVPGDSAAAVSNRRNAVDLRERNWRQAALLWQRIATVSGFSISESLLDDALGLTPGPKSRSARPVGKRVIGAALIVAFLAGLLASGLASGTAAAFALACLMLLTVSLEETHLHQPLTMLDVTLLTAGAVLPAMAHADTTWLLPLLAGFSGLTWLERTGRQALWQWLAAGLLMSGPVFWLGWTGGCPGLLLAAITTAFGLAAPARLAPPCALSVLIGAAAGTALALAMPVHAPSTAGLLSPTQGLAALTGAAAVLLLAFAGWWIHGTLFRFTPWLTIGGLGFTMALPAITAASHVAGGALALSGFGAILLIRLSRPLFPAYRSKQDRAAT